MGARAGRVIEMPGSHSPFLAQPERLSALIAGTGSER
jgi:hypothetical protein